MQLVGWNQNQGKLCWLVFIREGNGKKWEVEKDVGWTDQYHGGTSSSFSISLFSMTMEDFHHLKFSIFDVKR